MVDSIAEIFNAISGVKENKTRNEMLYFKRINQTFLEEASVTIPWVQSHRKERQEYKEDSIYALRSLRVLSHLDVNAWKEQ